MNTLKIYLIRHGQSLGNVQDSAHYELGDARVPLTDLGWEQSFKVGKFFNDKFPQWLNIDNSVQFPTVWLSPYLRAQQTFEGLLAGMQITMQSEIYNNHIKSVMHTTLNLIEQFHGIHEYISEQFKADVTFANLQSAFQYIFEKDPYCTPYIYGESLASLSLRSQLFLFQLQSKAKLNNITEHIVVSHGAIMKSIIMNILQFGDPEYYKLFSISNCDVITLHLLDNTWKCSRIYSGEYNEELEENIIISATKFHYDSTLPEFIKSKLEL